MIRIFGLLHFGGSVLLMAMFFWISGPVILHKAIKEDETREKQWEKLSHKEKMRLQTDKPKNETQSSKARHQV